MRRGDVRLIQLMLPDPEDKSLLKRMRKLAVILRPQAEGQPDAYVPFLLASSWRGRAPAAYEVVVPTSPEGFDNDTVIDARWPFTMQVRDFERHLFTLPPEIMREVDEALVVGLHMAL